MDGLCNFGSVTSGSFGFEIAMSASCFLSLTGNVANCKQHRYTVTQSYAGPPMTLRCSQSRVAPSVSVSMEQKAMPNVG